MPPKRHDPCPCGSGRNYKQCCGRTAASAARPAADAARSWALLQAGRPAEAEAECERLLARQPTLGQALLCLGLARRMQGKDAVAALESASRSLPGDAQLHYVLGQALEDHRLTGRAAESFARAAALRPDFAEAHNELGRVLLELGRTDEAIASCQRALALRPDFAEALGNLANAERARGALPAAIEGYRRVTELEPELAEAHHHLGSALAEAGERDAAIVALRRAIEFRPDYPNAVAQLTRLLTAADRGAEAIPYFERLLARDRDTETLLEYGNLLSGLRHYESSARCFREALAGAPNDARLHANLSHVLHCLGDLSGSIEHGRRAVDVDPRLPEAHLHLGNSLFAINEMHAAAAAYGAGLEVAPDHAALHTALAMVERSLGLLDSAEARTRRALAIRPCGADAIALLGGLAIDRGRFDEATELLREALAIDPELPEALTSLMAMRKMTPGDAPWRDAAQRLLARPLPIAHAINLHHTVGKYYDDVGDYDAAFQHHRKGNELARRSRPRYDSAAMTQRVTRVLAVFDRCALETLRRAGLDSERPVFIVGMPRSGTTLAEQILASHPNVHGAGEQLYWNFAADLEAAAPPEQRAATIAELGREYLATLARLSAKAARVVDKLPSNFRNLGLIHAALPQARVIHLERNPLDTCVSIYFQGFTAGHPYATDFDDLAHYYREYRRLMAHWRATLPAQTLLEVPYEGLVEDPEGWSRRMLAHLGLSWDPRCLEFHRTERPVLTASRWQVRQPISKGSVGRWHRYERFLGPLRETLGEDALERGRESTLPASRSD